MKRLAPIIAALALVPAVAHADLIHTVSEGVTRATAYRAGATDWLAGAVGDCKTFAANNAAMLRKWGVRGDRLQVWLVHHPAGAPGINHTVLVVDGHRVIGQDTDAEMSALTGWTQWTPAPKCTAAVLAGQAGATCFGETTRDSWAAVAAK